MTTGTGERTGVRFAHYFGLIVPFGTAVLSVGIGDGREAFGTPGGQLAVLVALAIIAGCWVVVDSCSSSRWRGVPLAEECRQQGLP